MIRGAVHNSDNGVDEAPPLAMLAGVRVIDLTNVVFGPLATQVLADYGADVIKIESLDGDIMRHAGHGTGDGMGPVFLNLNRGKRSIALDLKTAQGQAVLTTLLGEADVFVHNVRRQAIARLGFSRDAVAASHPHIVYCAATGFSAAGARGDAAAIDEVIQAAAGLASLNADADGVPRLVQCLVADKVAGLALACAILAALFRRERTGVGSAVDVPMYETLAGFMLLEHLQGEAFEPARGAVGYHRVMKDGRRIYRASDGYVAMTPYTTEHWAAFFTATGRADLATDPRITDAVVRNAHVAELYTLIGEVAGSRSVAEWEALAGELGFPAQRVRALAEVVHDPDLWASSAIAVRPQAGTGNVRMLASPGFFDGRAARHPGGAPRLGEHTYAILAEAGLTQDHIARLARDGVVRGQETSA